MTEELEFKHISVSSNDDDEVVIQAGALGACPDAIQIRQQNDERTAALVDSERAGASVPENAADKGNDEGATRFDSMQTSRSELLEEVGLQEADISEEAREEYERHMRKSEARQQATRMVTTEEDLHTNMPFAHMQRIIVIVLALLFVAAIAYWYVRHAG